VVSGQVKEASLQYQVSRDSCDSEDLVEGQVCPLGYKQTEVGVIPEDWSLVQLDKLANKIIDGTHHTPTYTKHGVPFLRVTDVQSNEIDFSKLKYVSIEEHEILIKRCKPEKGDLLLSKNGTIGIPKVVTWDWTFSVFVSLALIKLKKKKLSPEFLEQFFKSDYLDLQIKQKSKQGTVTNLHLEEIKEFLIPLPPFLKEQTAIANALSDVDALITSLEKLITKKRAIKTAAMQQLLTGKKRLPPFDLTHTGYKQTELGEIPEDWDVSKIANLAEIIRGASPRPKGDKRYYGGNVPRLMVQDVTRDGMYVTPQIDFLTEAGAKLSRPCTKGTLTLVCSGTVGVPSILAVDACIHDGFLGLVKLSKKVVRDYLYQFFKTQQERFDNSATHGGVFTNLTTDGVREFLVPVPPTVEEQTAIANVLSDVDKEIDTLEQSLNKTQQLKQGMMQELLTGRTRLL
jgi:type I restriction enzyme S subunit